MSLPNMKKPCSQCPFRKDTLKGWLGADRMDEIIKQESFVCHKTAHDEKGKLRQCAGHMLLNGEANSFVKTSVRMGIKLELSGRELVFDNAKDCVEHHLERG